MLKRSKIYDFEPLDCRYKQKLPQKALFTHFMALAADIAKSGLRRLIFDIFGHLGARGPKMLENKFLEQLFSIVLIV